MTCQRMHMLGRAEMSDAGARVDERSVSIADGSIELFDVHGRSVIGSTIEVVPCSALFVEESLDVPGLGIQMRECPGEAVDDVRCSFRQDDAIPVDDLDHQA